MHQLLEQQLQKLISNRDNLPEDIKKLLDEVSNTYTVYENMSESIKEELAQELRMENTKLWQYAENQTSIINNLKAAIAALEPNAEILTQQVNFDNSVSYLINSLVRLIEARKVAEEALKVHAKELEVLNAQLNNEKNKLAQEKATDQAILFAIGDGLVATNVHGQIVLVNTAFERLLGLKAAEVHGKIIEDMLVMVDQEGRRVSPKQRVYPLSSKFPLVEMNPSETFYYQKKDGTSFPITITAAPITIGNKIIGAVEVFRDITQEKEIEKTKNEFVALASHQLRTPLSSTNWYTEMLISEDAGKITEEQKTYLNEIAFANQRMTNLVNSLLNVSRVELGTFSVEPQAVDLKAIVAAVLQELKIKINEKKLEIIENYPKGLKPFNGDPKLLDIIIDNLVSNAVKYTPEKGRVEIHISPQIYKINNTQRKYIDIKVSDTGYGIPKDQQDKIFTKMFRASNIKTKDTDGNGLGLYIVKSVIENTGGRIWFESEENKGTTFHVIFPYEGMKPKKGSKSLSK